MRPRRRTFAALAISVALGACSAPDGSGGIPASLEAPSGGPLALATVPAAPAEGMTGPGGSTFSVALRSTELDQYPCTSCHEGATPVGERGEEEHADVQPVHPQALAESCEVCHEPTNPGLLGLMTGETVHIDQAYRLCAQCHFEQGEAWAGGAHGKRMLGWRGNRVVTSCTGCHDPHRPLFEKRIPFRGPNIPRTGGTER